MVRPVKGPELIVHMDTTSFEEAMRQVLRDIAKAFGIDYATMAADYRGCFHTGGVVRFNPIRTGDIPAILSRGYEVPASRFWPWRLIAHLGYNPQLLLEEHRGQEADQ